MRVSTAISLVMLRGSGMRPKEIVNGSIRKGRWIGELTENHSVENGDQSYNCQCLSLLSVESW